MGLRLCSPYNIIIMRQSDHRSLRGTLGTNELSVHAFGLACTKFAQLLHALPLECHVIECPCAPICAARHYSFLDGSVEDPILEGDAGVLAFDIVRQAFVHGRHVNGEQPKDIIFHPYTFICEVSDVASS